MGDMGESGSMDSGVMSVMQAIASRRTHNGRFKPDPVLTEHVYTLAHLAQRAPSSINTQPWRFFWLMDRADIDAIADISRDSWYWIMDEGRFLDRYKPNIHVPSKASDTPEQGKGIHVSNMPRILRPLARLWNTDKALPIMRLARIPSQMADMQDDLVRSSPLILAGGLDKETMYKSELDTLYAITVLGAAMVNIWNTVGSLDMGMQFISGPQEAPGAWQKVERVIGIPDSVELKFIWRLGYLPEEDKPNRFDWNSPQRSPLSENNSVKLNGGLGPLPDDEDELRRSRGGV
ncbi:nitroreductase family protein [Rubrobacter aplysinae]|uniref:nitroreductase family protein n=1 Tax=Rubrobacter aplysinae TaxID=909625 RepID=UPI00069CFA74|nr:nitroreductase family protein [Rubrobacter aplysinae]